MTDFDQEKLMRLILDTSIVVAAFRSLNGASHRLFDLFDLHRFDLLISTALILEYEAVLTRPEQRMVHGFSISEIDEVLDTLIARSIRVKTHFQWRPQLTDAGDEFVLEAAINGSADAIVNHNTAHFKHAGPRFGIEVFTPGRIIKERFGI